MLTALHANSRKRRNKKINMNGLEGGGDEGGNVDYVIRTTEDVDEDDEQDPLSRTLLSSCNNNTLSLHGSLHVKNSSYIQINSNTLGHGIESDRIIEELHQLDNNSDSD